MASNTSAEAAAARELELIGKVELRFALADSDTKLESLLGTYLAPLLLKLESPNEATRNKIVSFCQHIGLRIKPKSIKLPVAALVKQFKEHDGALLRHFDLVYIQQGLDRMPTKDRVELLPTLISGIENTAQESEIRASLVFNLILRILPYFSFPQRGSPLDSQLRESLGFFENSKDADFMCFWLGKLILFTPSATSDSTRGPGLSSAEYRFLYPSGVQFSWDQRAEGGQNLQETKIVAAKFLASGAFSDAERFLPALFASADHNSRLADIGEDMLKRFQANLEDHDLVSQLFELFFGEPTTAGHLPVRPALQTRILGLLCKSKTATTFVERILQLTRVSLLASDANTSNHPTAQGLEASKLRGQIFSFISWAARVGEPADIGQFASEAITAFRGYIESQGWPNPASTGQKLVAADQNLRSNAYESIGILAPKVNHLNKDEDLDLLRWLFTSLSSDASSDQIFVSIEQALGSILNAYATDTSVDVQHRLRSILTYHMTLDIGTESAVTGYKVTRSTRFAAVRFANRCLPYGDIPARWIDLMAMGGISERHEVVEEGKKGLDPHWYRMLNPIKDGTWKSGTALAKAENPRYAPPSVRDLIKFMFMNEESGQSVPSVKFQITGRFTGSFIHAFSPAASFCRNTLVCEALSASETAISPTVDWDSEIDAVVSTNAVARADLRKFLKQMDQAVALTLFKALFSGLIWNEGQGLGRCGEQFVELCSLASDDIIAELAIYSNLLRESLTSNNRQTRETAAQAYGILASHPKYAAMKLQNDLKSFMERIVSWKSAVGQVANSTHGAILSVSYVLGRLAIRGRADTVTEDLKTSYMKSLLEILVDSRDSLLRAAVHTSIGQLSIFSVLSPSALPSSVNAKSVIEKLVQDAKAENERPIIALGRFGMIFPVGNDTLEILVDHLYKLHEIRRPEVQFAVGEALATTAAGWSSRSLLLALDVDAEQPGGRQDQTFFADILERILQDCRNTKPALKKAAAIWLLCFTQYLGNLQEVQDRLRKFQSTFVSVLSDRDEVLQETGSRGLSLVYEMGDKELKDALVRDLIKSFTSTKAPMGGTVSADTELFEPGALPTGDGSVTTYKDIMSLASEVGDPSLVYRFMSLASHNAIWSSRAAFGRFGLSSVLSDSGYLAQNPKIYPVLYRFKFDPNPNVQRSMNDIWESLVKDSNAVIDEHFDAIMEALLKSILAREWRERQASCAAIGDLVQGRELDKFEKYLHEIWNSAFKVLDDIKETVRVAAMSLCQVLTNQVMRSLEVGDSSSKRSQAMLDNVLPFLLSSAGLDSSAEEVQSYAISTLLQIIKKAPSKSLRAFIPQILENLLGSLSSLEPQAINYIHLNSDKYGMTGNEIDKMRMSSMKSSPIMEALERCLDGLDAQSMKEAVVKLEDSLRSVVGLPSKVGSSRVIIILSTRHNVLFRPYADKILQLLRKLVLDRNDTVSASYSSAIGYIIRLATEKQVMQTIEFSKSLYFESEDLNYRSISGEIVFSMSKLSSDKFTSVAAAVLPFVFLAKHDSDEQVRELFEKTWQDNVGGSRALALFLQEIVQLVSGYLDSPRWVVKHASALAVAELAASFEGEISIKDGETVWGVLQKALAGKSWEGKEDVLKAFIRFAGNSRQLWRERKEIGDQMKIVAVREAQRKNLPYQAHALRHLGEFAQLRDDQDMSAEVFQIVRPIMEGTMEAADSDNMDVDSGPATATTETVFQEVLASSLHCLLRSIHPGLMSPAALTARIQDVLSTIEASRTQASNSFYLALFEGGKNLFVGLDQADTGIDSHRDDQGARGSEMRGTDDWEKVSEFARVVAVGPTEHPHATRAAQAQAWLAFAAALRRRRQPGVSLPWARQSTLLWLDHERSGPIQQTLRKALELIDS